jgi:hypothetical protein
MAASCDWLFPATEFARELSREMSSLSSPPWSPSLRPAAMRLMASRPSWRAPDGTRLRASRPTPAASRSSWAWRCASARAAASCWRCCSAAAADCSRSMRVFLRSVRDSILPPVRSEISVRRAWAMRSNSSASERSLSRRWLRASTLACASAMTDSSLVWGLRPSSSPWAWMAALDAVVMPAFLA